MSAAPPGPVDVLLVSLGSTAGLRAADEELARSLRSAGVSVALATARPPRPLRTLALTDLAWALAARRAAKAQIERLSPRSVVYCTTTAALLWPAPGAIRFDAPAAGNRPGRDGIWQRPLERRRLAQAPLLLAQSDGALGEAPASARRGARALTVPVAVEPSQPSPAPAARDIAAIAYAANPAKKGIDRVLAAWRAVSPRRRAARARRRAGRGSAAHRASTPTRTAVRSVGVLGREDYRALLRRARVFVCAPRREDYGIAQLEALADGCQLVTTPAPGPYAALPIARELDARLVGEDLGRALRAALDDPSPQYAERASRALAPFRREAVDRLVAEQLVPRLLG